VSTELRVASARPEDAPGLARLLSEMQRHYGAPVSDASAIEAATWLCHLPPEGFNPRTLLAHADGGTIGSCVLNVMIPAAELRCSLYIRDLFVSAATRRRGVGRALVVAAVQLVRDGGFCALDWTTDRFNEPARRLYEGAGATVVARTYYRLEGAALGRLLDGASDQRADGAEGLLDHGGGDVEMRAGTHAPG
jgi:GNAT superfamily N-acetyltransferase